jgi:hypothetical protein
MSTTAQVTVQDATIRPFRIEVPKADLVELRRRIAATRWPDQDTVSDRAQGAQLARFRLPVEYWGSAYDWRRAEAELNALPQFVTQLDGLDVQFAHIPSAPRDAPALLMAHGWPGSIFELPKVVESLTNPTAHGGSAEDAFHFVVPTLPGYGFSGIPTSTPTLRRDSWGQQTSGNLIY